MNLKPKNAKSGILILSKILSFQDNNKEKSIELSDKWGLFVKIARSLKLINYCRFKLKIIQFNFDS